MHPNYRRADVWSREAIGAGIGVHRNKGPGLIESVCQRCMMRELVEKFLPIHKAPLLSYMKLLNVPLGLTLNFHEAVLKNGIHRLILEGADAG